MWCFRPHYVTFIREKILLNYKMIDFYKTKLLIRGIKKKKMTDYRKALCKA
jgi:hypothetical protein